MPELTSKQRKALRSLAHSLRPVVQVGQSGLTPAVLREVEEALLAHELIKVQLAGDRDERRGMAATLTDASGAALASVVGRMAILYRPHPEADKRKITLPG